MSIYVNTNPSNIKFHENSPAVTELLLACRGKERDVAKIIGESVEITNKMQPC